MPNPQTATVFLSHSSDDKEVVREIAAGLHRYRLNVWFDEWEIRAGDSLRKKIFKDGLEACDVFLVLVTTSSLKSNWVQEELDAAFVKAVEQSARLIPVVRSNEIIKSLPIELRSRKVTVLNDEQHLEGLISIALAARDAFELRLRQELRADLNRLKKKNEEEMSLLQKEAESDRNRSWGQIGELREEVKTLRRHIGSVADEVASRIEPVDERKKILRLPKHAIGDFVYDPAICPACLSTKVVFTNSLVSGDGGYDYGWGDYNYTCSTCNYQYTYQTGK